MSDSVFFSSQKLNDQDFFKLHPSSKNPESMNMHMLFYFNNTCIGHKIFHISIKLLLHQRTEEPKSGKPVIFSCKSGNKHKV